MKNKVKATMVQLTLKNGSSNIIERMIPFFEKAHEYGSDIIVFPEYILGNRITINHERVKKFFALSKKYNIYAIAGMVESHGEQWTTSALLSDRDGNLLGRYFKVHPAAGKEPHFWPPDETCNDEAKGILGNQFKVFHLDFGKIGILQCYDGYFPEAWGCTSFEGAEVIFWINGREGMIEDGYCKFASDSYGCVIGANITNGSNTGFCGPWGSCIEAEGKREEGRLFPRIPKQGDRSVDATIDLKELRNRRKHLRTIHQRRPELYGRLTQDIRLWQDYPDIDWVSDNCYDMTNKSQL